MGLRLKLPKDIHAVIRSDMEWFSREYGLTLRQVGRNATGDSEVYYALLESQKTEGKKEPRSIRVLKLIALYDHMNKHIKTNPTKKDKPNEQTETT